ncbi:homoserine acetyltransferase [Pseudoxanthomonas dokdonensis]|uniref:Homoserine acetyltransferase n=1 Tax=Pseudoxanthomonas dokdonensis TaxID=344882 RepID=A0A0R0CKK9_9GAMM|nr:homoserine O-succinyltransferase [Pseudoxanthomonas dokdonensis]KRG70149.1 homoserine acetyltransferase [Pseudoxanthomonas dokdonensis]
MNFATTALHAVPADATAIEALLPDDVVSAQSLRGEWTTDLSMRHAGARRLLVRYELQGPAGAPVVLVAGGISAHRHLRGNDAFPEKGWLNELVGTGRALDPAQRRLLAIDYLGADGRLDAPIDTADQADAIAGLLQHLGIGQLQAFVGYSYGALVGLQLALRHPPCLQRLVAVSGAHRPHPFASAWRALQRKAVTLGALQCAETQGLSLARQFAMLSYRTPEEFEERFDAPPEIINGRVRCAAEDYLDAAGAQYVARTPVTAYVRLSESIDLHRVDASQIRVPTTVVAVEGDRLVPLSDSVALVEALGTLGTLRVLRSPYGHDAFLKEPDRIDAILVTALRGNGANP